MTYQRFIELMKESWLGQNVRYCGETYKVEDVDEDAFLTIRNEKGSAIVECTQLDTEDDRVEE